MASEKFTCNCVFVQISTNLFGIRRCGGSFGSMGAWESPDVADCVFDQKTREICDLSDVSVVMQPHAGSSQSCQHSKNAAREARVLCNYIYLCM